MNPRYLAYCKTHGLTPEEMKEKDANRFPGGSMTGFILWIRKAKLALYNVHPEYFIGLDTFNPRYDALWDLWLTNYNVVV